jgi:hypothetical protein
MSKGKRHKPEDFVDRTFGRLTIQTISRVPRKRGLQAHCLCVCGNPYTARLADIAYGGTTSCGCARNESMQAAQAARKERTRQLPNNDPAYNIWYHLVARCTDPKSKIFLHYGGVGVTICQGLKDRDTFLQYAGPRPSERHTLVRIPNEDGHYHCGQCPECLENARPRNIAWVERQRRMLTHDGQTHTLREWARIAGIPLGTIQDRLRRGRSPEQVLAKIGMRFVAGGGQPGTDDPAPPDPCLD